MAHATLFKKTSTGKIQTWSISVRGDTIVTTYGLQDGKKQTTEDVIREGKNLGKVNETLPHEQAELEALAKWQKQKKKGYVEHLADAEAGKKDALIEGGIDTMLAHSYSKQGHKIVYPAFSQPKIDGIRCIAILKDGKCTLWSRTRKRITGVPHIEREVEKVFDEDIVLDGELYSHDFKSDFEQIVHFVRQETPTEGHEVVQYHVYDLINDEENGLRMEALARWYPAFYESKTLKMVETVIVLSFEELLEKFSQYLLAGYEGAMVRNYGGKYVGRRSADLQKLKEFEDAEFKIVGVSEGRGKLAGHAATFVCVTETGNQFEAKMKGSTAKLKEYWDNHSLWEGKKLTVRYQGLTNTNSVPRFPVGVAVRNYE